VLWLSPNVQEYDLYAFAILPVHATQPVDIAMLGAWCYEVLVTNLQLQV
jgi:hypothetical protein